MASFAEVRARLTPDAQALYLCMVDAHLQSEPGMRHFIITRTGGGPLLMFAGTAPFGRGMVDDSTFNDLVTLGLLRRARGIRGTAYEVSGDSVRFHQWLRQALGGAFTATEEIVRRLVDSAAYASAHPAAAAHLESAFERLWADRTDSAAVTSFGLELLGAVSDAVADSIGGPPVDPEDVPGRLKRWVAEVESPTREAPAVAALTQAAWRIGQRLKHIEQETVEGRPLRGNDEMRRAAFLTVATCAELAAI